MLRPLRPCRTLLGIGLVLALGCSPGSLDRVSQGGNRAPTASFGNSNNAVEGSFVAFDASASHDPDGDTLTYAWNFGDGTSAVGRTATHIYRNNGQYHATLVVTDSHDASDTAATTIPVANAPPVITGLTTPSVVVLGTAASIQVSFSDPGVDDTLTASVDWADQSSSPITPGTATHTYTTLGSYVVTVTVRDQDGGVAVKRAATAISVSSNRAPHAHINGGVTGTQEGARVFYDATGSSDPDGDSLTYQWQFSDGSADVKGFAVEHTFIDQGKYVITL